MLNELYAVNNESRSPHGERGLKCLYAVLIVDDYVSLPARGAWIEISDLAEIKSKVVVAPRTGSVD